MIKSKEYKYCDDYDKNYLVENIIKCSTDFIKYYKINSKTFFHEVIDYNFKQLNGKSEKESYDDYVKVVITEMNIFIENYYDDNYYDMREAMISFDLFKTSVRHIVSLSFIASTLTIDFTMQKILDDVALNKG